MRAMRFMVARAPSVRARKVSQAGLPVKDTRVNAPHWDAIFRRPGAPDPQDVESLPHVRTQSLVGVTPRTRLPRFRSEARAARFWPRWRERDRSFEIGRAHV